MTTLPSALIGYTGFVGSTLLRQTSFDRLYRSTNIDEIDHQHFNLVVCAGAPAQKWLANKDPESDSQKINGLIEHLKTVQCKTFVLISTVDVFKQPVAVNEKTVIDETDLHAYGLHRWRLEQFVMSHFSEHLIVRLPGLVGPGLRKNIIFDFLNQNNLNMIDSRGVFQFYPMVNLWYDIQLALQASLKLVHLTAQPVSVADVSELGFSQHFKQEMNTSLVVYDMQTCHAHLFHGVGNYQYSARETIQAIRCYAQSEPVTLEQK